MRNLDSRASRKLTLWLVPLIVLAVAVTPLLAQTSTGGLTIRVLDENDEPLPGATVVLSSLQKKVATTAEVTNKKGQVRFPVLAAGSGYVIEVSFPGYGTQKRDLLVKIGEDSLVTVKLAEEFTEEVRVVAQAEVVELEKTKTSTKFSDDFIGDLPVAGRFYTNVLTLAPGVQDANNDGNPNVHGSRSRDFKAVVSGVANVDPLTGQQASQVNMDSIEEIEVITAGAGPEFGRAQGGFANIIQKQGSNEFEGVFTFLFQSSKLDGDGAGNTPRINEPKFQTLRPSFQVSGPILKDRLWYRLSHDWISREDPINVVNSVEVSKTEQLISSDQITWQVSDRNKLAFRYEAAPIEIDNFGVSSTLPPESAQIASFDTETYSVTWEAPYSPQVYVKSLVAFQQFGLGRKPTTSGVINNCVSGAAFFESARCFDAETTAWSGSYPLIYDDDRERFTVKTDATMYPRNEWLGMSHQFDFGFIVENERFEVKDTRKPDLTFFLLNPEADDPNVEQRAVVIANFRVPETRSDEATGTTWGFYVKDQMKPRQNIAIELGVRVDREVISADGVSAVDPRDEFQRYTDLLAQGLSPTNARRQSFSAFEQVETFKQQLASILGIRPTDVNSFFGPATIQASFQNQFRRPVDIHLTNTNVSPFFAISWDPWSNGKTKVALTVGRNYNNIPLIVPTVELEPANTSVRLNATNDAGNWVISDPEGQINPAPSVSLVDRNLKTPYQDELSVTFERELWTETSMTLSYIKRKFRDQIQDIDINNVIGDYGRCRTVTVAGQPPLDTSQGPDGIIDDCTGDFLFVPGQGEEGNPLDPANRIARPDGFADLYTLNPFWGPVFLIGNYNEADYDGVVLSLQRRQYRGWEMQGSYTWSQAEGNGEDFFQENGDDPANFDDEFGYQSYDQRHVVKWQGTKVTPWGVRLGAVVQWQSGLPYSLQRRNFSLDTPAPTLGIQGNTEPRIRVQYPTGQRNDQRNVSYWLLDLKATKEFSIGTKMNMQLSVDVFNVFNNGVYQVYNPFFEQGVQVNGQNQATRLFGRRWQLSARVAF